LHTILTNLLTNAIEFSNPNSEIKITLANKGNLLVVSVQDFGLGMALRDQAKIYNRLMQLHMQFIQSLAAIFLIIMYLLN